MINNFEWLAWMRPTPDQKQAANEFEIRGAAKSKDPSFVSEGIFGQITGRRADLIIPDDVETPNTADTETSRENLQHRTSEFSAILKPGGEIHYLGTAHTEDTLYLKREEAGYEIRIWPIVYPKNDKDFKRYGGRLSPTIQEAWEKDKPALSGQSTEPMRFDAADIAQRRLEYGKTEFNRQYRMFIDAGSEDSKPLKLRDLMVLDLDPNQGLPSTIRWEPSPQNRLPQTAIQVDSLTGDSLLYGPTIVGDAVWGKPERVTCVIDPSGAGDDETTWTIGAEKNGWIYCLWQGASLGGTSAPVLEEISGDCKKWGVNLVKIESNFGQDMLEDLLRPHLTTAGVKASIEMERAGQGFKEARIVQHLEPVMTGHRLVINAEILRRDFNVGYDVEDAKKRFYRLTYQLTRMQKAKDAVKHDDRVEGLANLCKEFSFVLRRNEEQIEEDLKTKEIWEEYRKMEEYRRKHGLPPINPNTEYGQRGRGGLIGIGGSRDKSVLTSPYGKRKHIQ